MIEQESHSHAHHTGLPWLDLILAGSAIFISVVSVIISIHHGRTMEKLVEANEKQVRASTLPILRFTTGNLDSTDKIRTIHFDLANGGTGPALIEWLRIKWNGAPTAGPRDLLARCCSNGSSGLPSFIWVNTASGMNLPAAQSQMVFYVRADSTDADLYKRLDDARFKLEPEACYCSVLDECWITDFKSRAKAMKSCEAVPADEHW